MTPATTTSLGSRAAFTRWLMLGIVASASAALLTGCLGHLKHPFKHDNGRGHSSIGPAYSPLAVPSEFASLDTTAPVAPSDSRLAAH